ncbi:putative PB1 domain-containing protein [Helianthus anomalus]
MENYSYNSYPESGGSSPRSREIDFENPTPWEADQPPPNTTTYKVKLMCSYGGKIHPRPHDNQLAYVGGETKILSVDRSIKFSLLLAKLSALCDVDVCFKYQLPGEDLDALISVTNDDDLDHMMIEYDRLNRASPKPARLRLFLFPVIVQSPAHSFGSTEGRSERERFVEALNSGPVPSSTVQSHGNADFLFGSEKGVAPAPVTVPKARDLPVVDPPLRHHDPDLAVLDERNIGTDRIQKHIQDLRRLRIAEDQQQNLYRDDNNNQNLNLNLSGGYSGDYYVQRPSEKVVTTPLPASVPSPAQGYQISGGYSPSTLSADQQPVYMVQAQSSMYHAPIARPVTAPIGHNPVNQVQGQSQGYYAVQRMPAEAYRDPPVYNAMQPVQTMSTPPMFPPQQQPPVQKLSTEGIRMIQSTAGMTDGGYTQVAYDNSLGRHVYYTAQGALVTPHQQLQQQQPPPPLAPPQQQHQVHQFQQVAAVSATSNQIQDGKVIAPITKITQGSI